MSKQACGIAIKIDEDLSRVVISQKQIEAVLDPVLVERTLNGETIYLPVVDNTYQVVYK